MTTDEKMLLIEDLCCRLPFGVKCYIPEKYKSLDDLPSAYRTNNKITFDFNIR